MKLERHQFAVDRAELATGTVLNNDGSWFLKGQDERGRFEVFETFEDAKAFVIKTVKSKPEIECYIQNSKGDILFIYDRYGERKIRR